MKVVVKVLCQRTLYEQHAWLKWLSVETLLVKRRVQALTTGTQPLQQCHQDFNSNYKSGLGRTNFVDHFWQQKWTIFLRPLVNFCMVPFNGDC